MGLARECGSCLSISLQRFLAKERSRVGGICLIPRPQSGWVFTTTEGSRYWGEEGGLASIYSSRTHGPICVWISVTTCRLAYPASSLAISSEEKVKFKSRLLANQRLLAILSTCSLLLPHRTYMRVSLT